jgi:hypothetical protein
VVNSAPNRRVAVPLAGCFHLVSQGYSQIYAGIWRGTAPHGFVALSNTVGEKRLVLDDLGMQIKNVDLTLLIPLREGPIPITTRSDTSYSIAGTDIRVY